MKNKQLVDADVAKQNVTKQEVTQTVTNRVSKEFWTAVDYEYALWGKCAEGDYI